MALWGQSRPPLPGDGPWQLRPPSGQAGGCTRIVAPSLGRQACPLSPDTVSRGPASIALSSLPRSLHASTPDSLGGPGARPRARDRSVSGEDRSPSPVPHTGQGGGGRGAGIGQRWHPGLRAATRRREAWEQRGGRQAGEDRRETRVACWGLSKRNTDKTYGWETSSPKVIFTRKLRCVDLLLCAEEFNYHVLRGVIISAAGSARNTPDPAAAPLAQSTPLPPGTRDHLHPQAFLPLPAQACPKSSLTQLREGHLTPPLCPGRPDASACTPLVAGGSLPPRRPIARPPAGPPGRITSLLLSSWTQSGLAPCLPPLSSPPINGTVTSYILGTLLPRKPPGAGLWQP